MLPFRAVRGSLPHLSSARTVEPNQTIAFDEKAMQNDVSPSESQEAPPQSHQNNTLSLGFLSQLLVKFRDKLKPPPQAPNAELEDTSPQTGVPGVWYRAELPVDREIHRPPDTNSRPYSFELQGSPTTRSYTAVIPSSPATKRDQSNATFHNDYSQAPSPVSSSPQISKQHTVEPVSPNSPNHDFHTDTRTSSHPENLLPGKSLPGSPLATRENSSHVSLTQTQSRGHELFFDLHQLPIESPSIELPGLGDQHEAKIEDEQ